MPVEIGGKVYYLTLEVSRKANVSRSTLLRCLKRGVLTKIRRDRRGWRLFTEDDLSVIMAEIERINVEEILRPK